METISHLARTQLEGPYKMRNGLTLPEGKVVVPLKPPLDNRILYKDYLPCLRVNAFVIDEEFNISSV